MDQALRQQNLAYLYCFHFKSTIRITASRPIRRGRPATERRRCSPATDPATLTMFRDFGGLFVTPTLGNNNTKLTVGITAFESNKYFYIFNITGPNGLVAMDDPIIVNR